MRFLLRLTCILSITLALTVAAHATVILEDIEVDWGNSYRFAGSGGLENPLLRVAFNPQPEPPAGGALSFGMPPDPAYPPDPVITHSGDFESGQPFRLLFGISNGMDLFLPTSTIVGGPDGVSLFLFDVMDAAGLKVFDVQLELSSSSGGSPIEWVAFNPQPEPPALGEGGALFGADFSFSSFSDVSLAIRVHDAVGGIITLTAIPEPGALLLTASGLLLLARRYSLKRPKYKT